MAYNTGNPIGSKSPKDLSDNAQNLDLLMLGGNPSYPDRKGVARKSWKGMEAEHVADQLRRVTDFNSAQTDRKTQFTKFLESSGYEAPVPYAAGLALERATQTVTFLGNEYRVKSQFLPLITTDWATDESRLKLIGDDSLRQTLAKPAGVFEIGWERGERSPIYTGLGGFLNASNFNLWEKEFVDKAVKNNPVDPATWDWAPALQAAIDKVVLLAKIKGTTYGLPGIEVPAFLYNMSKTILTAPWIKISIVGNTIFDFSKAPVNTQGINISGALANVTTDIFSFTGACLDASRGNLHLLGNGLNTSRGSAVFAGNSVDGLPVAREITLKNVTARNWKNALEFGKYGSYLFSGDGLRFENNFNGVVTPEGKVRNSGERMTITNSIIGGSGIGGAAILHRSDTMDLSFTNTSFDFNHDILRCDPGATYAAISFNGLCHFEGWDGYLVNWDSDGANFYVTFGASCTILPTTYRLDKPLKRNSPSRNLVRLGGTASSRVDVRFETPVIRHTSPPYTEDPFVALDLHQGNPVSHKGCRISSYDAYSFSAFGTRDSVSNTDFDFQLDPLGTGLASMKCWEKVTASAASDEVLVDDGTGKKVLRIRGTSATNYSHIRSKQWYPVKGGDTVFTWSSISIKGLSQPSDMSPLLPNVQLSFEIQYADGRTERVASRTVNMGGIFSDAEMPNFDEGKSRYIAAGSLGYLLPAGVVAVRPYIVYVAFVGDLYISRIGLWRQ